MKAKRKEEADVLFSVCLFVRHDDVHEKEERNMYVK